MMYLAVLGTVRSGKTLIGRALNMHPAVSVQIEPYFFFFKLCKIIFYRDIVERNIDSNEPLSSDFCKASIERTLFVQTFSDLMFNEEDIQELRRLTIRQQESEREERAPKMIPFLGMLKKGSAAEVLKNLMRILAHAYYKDNLKYIGLSEAWCDEFIGTLLNLPGNKFRCVHTIRDPRAVVASRNGGKFVMEKYGGKYPILFLIRHWRKSVAHSIANANNSRYLAVRYEDLVTSPKEWFQKICSHLSLVFDDRLVHPQNFINGCGELWKQNTNFEAGSGFSVDSIAKWKDVLTPEETGLIEWLCYPELEYLGYEITQKNFGLHELIEFFEDEKEIIEWLRPYNLTVNNDEIALEIIRRNLLRLSDFVPKAMMEYFFINEETYQAFLRKN